MRIACDGNTKWAHSIETKVKTKPPQIQLIQFNLIYSHCSASDDFNNGVVLTRRALRPNELFQVRLERVVSKWAGSIEIGITEHSPTELDFPFTMTNVRTGTWMMTG